MTIVKNAIIGEKMALVAANSGGKAVFFAKSRVRALDRQRGEHVVGVLAAGQGSLPLIDHVASDAPVVRHDHLVLFNHGPDKPGDEDRHEALVTAALAMEARPRDRSGRHADAFHVAIILVANRSPRLDSRRCIRTGAK